MVYDEDFEDEFEDEEEDDEFEDEFEDEFADDFEDEFSSFGPVYIQGETSQNFEAYAMVASFVVVLIAVVMLFSQVLDPVYDGMTAVEPAKYDGLGRKIGGGKEGPDQIAFAPPSVEVIGVGRYDTTGTEGEYDYVVISAGAEQGIGIGLIYVLHDEEGKPAQKMIVTAVEPQMARADFVEIGEADLETVNITRTYTDPKNLISHIRQDTVWQRETIRELLLMLDDGWRDRGVTEEEQIDAMERFATLGVPDRTGKPVFDLVDNLPSFDSSNEDAMGRAQLQVFNQLRSVTTSEAASMLRDFIRTHQPPWRMEDADGIAVPSAQFLPLEAPLSPVLRDSLVSEAVHSAEWDLARRLPEQFPDLNQDWNIVTWIRVNETDLVGKDSVLITGELIKDGQQFNLGRPINGVRAYLAEATEQVVITMILDRLANTIAESDIAR